MAKHKTTAQNISSQLAFKTLEVILHSLENKFSRTVSELQKDQGSLSTKQRLLLTDLNDSITHTKILLKDALRHRANVANNNFTFAEQGVAEQIQVEKVLSALASTTSAKDFQEFCNFCVKTLAELYESQYAFIGMLQPGGEQVQTLAVWAGDHFADNFEYDLAGTPCEDVINLNKELIPTHAAQLYPEDTMLVSMQVDSYLARPL